MLAVELLALLFPVLLLVPVEIAGKYGNDVVTDAESMPVPVPVPLG